MAKRKKWYEKHHEDCNALREKFGAKEGEGLSWLRRMKKGTETEQLLAATWEKSARDSLWSVDQLDAVMGAYHANPIFKLFDRAAMRSKLTVVDGGKNTDQLAELGNPDADN